MAVPLVRCGRRSSDRRDLPLDGELRAVAVAQPPDYRARPHGDATLAPVNQCRVGNAERFGERQLCADLVFRREALAELRDQKAESLSVGHHGAASCRGSPARVNET